VVWLLRASEARRPFAAAVAVPLIGDSLIYAGASGIEPYVNVLLRSEATVAKNSKVSRAHRDHEKLAAMAAAADAFSARSRGAITR
jgi:hypothetical protein